MSAIKKTKAVLVTTAACGKVNDKGEVEVDHVHTNAQPVEVEYVDESAGEVVYDAGKESGKSSVGYSRAYATKWDEIFGSPTEESLPN